ncbi:MAG TPA: hypothetical protein VJ912_00255 [Candidatus Nanoarchaeia archaeon]|nr:hypothetical protein [Candidatus Nanoarchaeia archaeon]
MQETCKLLIGIGVLILGFFIGNWISGVTKDEIKKGKKWFSYLVFIGLGGGIYGFIAGNDFLLFTFFFIAIVSSRSLKKSLEMNNKKKKE